MAKVTIYLPDELAERVRAAGISMSPVCQRALQEEVEAMEAAKTLASREERIVVERWSKDGAAYDEAFRGAWLVDPSDESRTTEDGYDAGACYGVARTHKGAIAVYVHHVNDRWEPQFSVYGSLQEAMDGGLPADIAAEAAQALGHVVELDI